MTVTQSSTPSVATRLADPVDSYIHFPEGLVGCGSWKRFVLLSEEDETLPVGLLQSLDEPGVSLLVTDPALVWPGYAATLSAQDRAALGLATDATPLLYCTLTIGKDGTITANLLGPLAINAESRQGKQVVLAESVYSARHLVGTVESASCSF